MSSEQESDRRRFRWPLVQWPDTCRSRPATFMTCGCIVIEPNGKNTTLQTTPRHVWTTEGCRLLSTLCSQLILVIFSFLSCIEILNNGIKGCITYYLTGHPLTAGCGGTICPRPSTRRKKNKPWTMPFPSDIPWEKLLTITIQCSRCMVGNGEHLQARRP